MKSIKFIAPAILAGIMSLVMYSCSKSDVYTPSGGGDDNTYKVNILATQFDPANTTMLVGGKVIWTNTDAQVHSIVSDDGISFNSGNISTGGTFNFTPTVNGTYAYHCGVHPTVTGNLYVVNK